MRFLVRAEIALGNPNRAAEAMSNQFFVLDPAADCFVTNAPPLGDLSNVVISLWRMMTVVGFFGHHAFSAETGVAGARQEGSTQCASDEDAVTSGPPFNFASARIATARPQAF
jgi:hypothetical protein